MMTDKLQGTMKPPQQKARTKKKVQDDALPPLEERMQAMLNRTPEEIEEVRKRIFAKSRPALPLPPGKTLEDVVVGILPNDESEQEIWAALAEL